jgi:hypothetical protein
LTDLFAWIALAVFVSVGWKCVTQLSMPTAIEIIRWITVVVHMNTGKLNKK